LALRSQYQHWVLDNCADLARPVQRSWNLKPLLGPVIFALFGRAREEHA